MMDKKILIKSLLTLIVVLFTVVGLNGVRGISSAIDDEFMKLEEIKKGMRGYGLSVFSGSKPKRFGVTILGVLRGSEPRGNLILGKFEGASLEKTGIIAGMSGSPIYINNKLVGAISHTFPWSKEPIGAIRPIGEMLKVLRSPYKNHPKTNTRFIPLDLTLHKKIIPKAYKETYPKVYSTIFEDKTIDLVPVRTPILFSGINENILSILRSQMHRYGFYPLNYGSGGTINKKDLIEDKNINTTLNPGDAVGIPLITGDMHAVPVGTVTYRRGNKVLIFGHPSFFKGPIDMPMSKEYIHTVVPSREISFKLSSTISIVGRIFNDKNSAVAGELGKASKTIPVDVFISQQNRKAKFHFNIVKDNIFFPNMLVSAIMQSTFAVNSQISQTSIKLKFVIRVRNVSTGEVKNVIINDFVSGNITEKNLFDGLFRLSLPIESLMFNPFIETEIESIKSYIDINYGWNISEIVDTKILKNNIKPGDTIPILVTLRSYKGKEFYKKIHLKLPSSVTQSKLVLGVSSGKMSVTTDKILSMKRYLPQTFTHLIDILNKDERFNDLVAWIDLPERGLVIDGQENPALPSSILSVLEKTGEEQSFIYKRIKKVFRSNQLILGIKTRIIDIEQEE